MKAPRTIRTRAGGFTLIEILVSITVLGLMMVGVAQMLNSAMIASLGGYKHLDADTQARMVLDRMAFDIAKMSRRADVDYYFAKNTNGATPGNDQMAFYSESGGYYPSGVSAATQGSEVSLVGYRINANNQLERLSKGLIWNGVSNTAPPMVYGVSATPGQLIGATWPNVVGSGNDPDYQVIGDQIFRLEYCFLVTQSNYGSLYATAQSATPPATPPTTTSPYLTDVPYATPDTAPNGMQDVVAVVVSIAVLDSQSQTIAKQVNPNALNAAGKDLHDVSAGGGSIATNSLPLTVWKNDLATTQLGLPKVVASQVRFYQRYCYLSHAQ